MKKGAFIVLDGLDGSGKATQTRLLTERLAAANIPFETLDFPSYGRTMFGSLIGEALAGKRGDFLHIDPRIGSTLYALDRYEMSPVIREWLSEGKIVIADRFTSSNQIHQGGKIRDVAERAEFMAWLEKMEYEVLDIPRPDAVIYLRVPVAISARLLAEKREAKNRMLPEGEKDTVERDEEYVERSYASAETLAEGEGNWHMIDCVAGEGIRTPHDINEEVFAVVKRILEA
jgi:dTMP kinase